MKQAPPQYPHAKADLPVCHYRAALRSFVRLEKRTFFPTMVNRDQNGEKSAEDHDGEAPTW